MADGKGCKCAAHSESECGCDADWTPQEVYDLRAEIERLRLTDAEREAIDWAAYAAEQWYEHTAAATLRGLLERLG
jgi:hypothetical protein